MNEQTNKSMITMTVRVPPELSRTLKQAGERLGTHYTTLVRQCLLAIVNPSKFGDMVLDSVRAAGVMSETGMAMAQVIHEMDRGSDGTHALDR